MSKLVPVNIDELATPQKAIILDGVTHTMRDLTLQEFIDRAADAKKVQDAPEGEVNFDELPFDEKVLKLIDMVHDAFPTVSRERLGRLHFAQLNAILDLTLKTPEQVAADLEAAKSGNA